MFEKAKSCTITQTVLNKMRYAEVELLSHQAEDTRDVEQFLTALKFAPTLITTTHAKNQTFVHAKFLPWWYCVSDAEKTIFEMVALIKKTVGGNNIFTDRFVVWIVRDIRHIIGKNHKVGTKNKLTQEAFELLLKLGHFQVDL